MKLIYNYQKEKKEENLQERGEEKSYSPLFKVGFFPCD